MQLALANEKSWPTKQERYEYRVTDEGIETDKSGKIKHDNIQFNE